MKELSSLPGSLILPFLYLGTHSDATNYSKLKQHNIKYILNVTNDLDDNEEYISEYQIKYKRIPANDSFDQNIRQYFQESFQFIDEAKRNGCNILIHCHAGISRSPTIVVAYLMYSCNMSFNVAYKFVESKRPIISPNFSFVGQLYEFEMLCRKKREHQETKENESDQSLNIVETFQIKKRSRKASLPGFTLLRPIKLRKPNPIVT